MLFYTVIFVVCLVAAFLITWLFSSLSDKRSAVKTTARPLSKIQSTSHLSTYARSATGRDPWAPQLAIAGAGDVKAGQELGGGGSYNDPSKSFSVPHQARTLLKPDDRISRDERRIVERAAYKVSRRNRVLQSNSKPVI